jgi:3-phosphoglycerate kinase
LLQKELEILGKALDNPDRPFVAILGGAKVSDKIGVIKNLIQKVDTLIIGGGMAYTFFKAKGYEIGKSLLEEDKVELASELMKKPKKKALSCFLPVDTVVAKEFKADAEHKVVPSDQIPSDWMGLDIGPESQQTIWRSHCQCSACGMERTHGRI